MFRILESLFTPGKSDVNHLYTLHFILYYFLKRNIKNKTLIQKYTKTNPKLSEKLLEIVFQLNTHFRSYPEFCF